MESDNWVVQNLQNALETWNEKLAEIWQILTQSPEEFKSYVDKCKELSLYDTGVSAEYGDKLITLSTCEYSRTNGRLVVVAKKVTESGGVNAPANDGSTEIPS